MQGGHLESIEFIFTCVLVNRLQTPGACGVGAELLLVMMKSPLFPNQEDRCDTSDEANLNETQQSWKQLPRIDSTSPHDLSGANVSK